MSTNKIYGLPETALTFKDSGGSAVLALDNVANGTGVISAQLDRGAGAKPMRYRAHCAFIARGDHTPVVGDLIEVYLATSDGTNVDGTVGTSSAALTTEKRRNLTPIGSVQVDVAGAANTVFKSTFTTYIYDRYISIGVWNGGADHIKVGSSVTLIPVTDEIQAAS